MKVYSVFTFGILILLFAATVGCSVLQEPQAASEPIEAIPLELQETAPSPTEAPPTEVPPTEEPPTQMPSTAVPATETPVANDDPAPTAELAEETAEESVEQTSNESQGLLVYQIIPGESHVRFELDEDLRGLRNTVVGSTDQVAGELAVDLADLSATQVGTLQINARTLATDNEFRNRAVKNDILNTNEYEFITFAPSAINGLPDSAAVGQTVAFTIDGDLTIRDLTHAETFDVEVTAVSAEELSGTATAVIQRVNYNLNIPSVPNVANVEEEVELYIDFIARTENTGTQEASAQNTVESQAAGLMLAENESLGKYLTDAAGMTLYTFANDDPGLSNCYDRCATAWPPLLVEEGETGAAADGIPGELGTTQREDGTVQITYDGWPLYYWFLDEAPGDTTGHNVGNVWAVAWPTTTILLGGNEELGSFLVGADGMTLYRFNADEPGLSSCYDQCAENWPPLLLEEGEALTGGAGVVGQLGTTIREEGSTQITYAGMPLYYWANDQNPGDATGHQFNDVWFVMPPYAVGVGSNEQLGDFLVDTKGMTLYQFANDEENVSSCYDQCAENWPPMLVQPGEVPIAGFNVSGDLGVIERQDDTLQATYNGIPLYYYIEDEAPGDTSGHEFNDAWFVIAP